ncbi:MAG: type IX secretion system membrane protein PorP/SprF [Chryseolinea sp.]
MKKLITIATLVMVACGITNGQQRPIHSLYMFDPLLINPAYVGTQVQLSGTAIYRNQWVNFPGAPKTFTASAHTGFKKERVGVGFLVGNDQIGIHSENSLYLMYAYKIPLSRFNTSKSSLSFGLQGGFNNLKSDFTKLNPKELLDPYASLVERNLSWNFGAGLYYRSPKFYAGISIPYLMNNTVVNVENLSSLAKQSRYYYLTAGFTHQLSAAVKLLPSTLIRIQEQAPLSFDLNLMTVLYEVVGLGVSYRLDDSVVGLFELQLNENFHVGYAYDVTTSDLRLYSNGTHEIMINYRVKINKWHKGIKCPSYW